MELVGFSNHSIGRIIRNVTLALDLKDAEADRAPGYVEETLESAGCTGQCPNYPGAPKTADGFPDCSKCPEWNEE